jgi:hypothetical protein
METTTKRNLKAELATVKKLYKEKLALGWSRYNAMLYAMSEGTPGEYTHGTECIQSKYTGTKVFYANAGDTYDTTVMCYFSYSNTRFVLGNWGDLVETGRYE